MSKRRRGFPSETGVKRGDRTPRGGDKELVERLGDNDPCPCGSGRRFQTLLPQPWILSTVPAATLRPRLTRPFTRRACHREGKGVRLDG